MLVTHTIGSRLTANISAFAVGVSVLALTVLGACGSPAKVAAAKVTTKVVTQSPTKPATPVVASAPPAAASVSPAAKPPKKEKRTPALTDGSPAKNAGDGKVIPGAVNVYTFDPEPKFTPVDASTTSITHVLADLGADATEWYQHVQTLSNPWFEGRAPGSEGIEFAAQYLQWWMQKYGLEPAFAEGRTAHAASSRVWSPSLARTSPQTMHRR